MSVDLGPKLGLLINADIGEQYYDQFRPFLRAIDELLFCSVINSTTTAPPSSPANGDAYLLLGSPTGAWAGQANAVAIWSTEITESGNNTKVPGWDFRVPNPGWLVWDEAATEFHLYSGSSWSIFFADSGITQLTGDVTAGPGSESQPATVVAIQGNPVADTAPSNSDVMVWSSSSYAIRQLTADDILPGFTITGFSGGSTVEVGTTVVNPAFTASYSSTPVSAAITNTDGIDSPLNLTTPFTGGTVTGSFSKSSAASTTFTLTAVSSSTKTAQQTIQWEPRSFGGTGSAGATSSVTASGTTAVLSTGDVLASAGLSDSNVGQIYGPYTPTAQKIYLLILGTGHTFKDASTGFAFAFNSPTAVSFVNSEGATIAMQLYETTNELTGSYSPEVVT